MKVLRSFRHTGFLLAATISIAACATRVRPAVIPEAPRSILPIWKLEIGDQIATKVYREPDLSSETTIGESGEAYFPGLGRVPVAGFTLDSLQVDLTRRYDKLVVDAAVDAVMHRDMVIYGQVRAPGVYNVDPSITVLGLLARAGGPSGSSKIPVFTLVKGDGRQFLLSREERLSTLDIVHGDAIFVQEQSFLGRNAQSIGTFTLLSTLVISLVSILVLFTSR
jgi:Polysaccharide biosynthesis/export protein